MRRTCAALARLAAALLIAAAGPAATPALAGDAISAAFSPSGGAEALVLQVIGGAHATLRVAAYDFTSVRVAQALAQARQRGVDVRVLIDQRANLEQGRGHARRALALLLQAGVALRAVDAYPIFHDKYLVVDSRTVQTGSFNYTVAAARRNAENVLVVWDDPALARRYLDDWGRQWSLGRPLTGGF